MVDQTHSFIAQFQEAAAQAENPKAAAQAQMQLIGQWIAVCPLEFFSELREHAPILAAPAFTLVTRYADVQQVLTLNDIFTTDLLKHNMEQFIGNTVVELPPSPEYERRKSILRLAFPMQDLERYRQILIEEAALLLKRVDLQTGFDVTDYAKKLPAAAMSRYLGLGELPVDQVVQWMHDINEGAVRNLANLPRLNEPAAAASAAVKPLIRDILERTRKRMKGQNSTPSFWQRLFKPQPAIAPSSLSDPPTVLERYLHMQSVASTFTADEDIISSLLFMLSACIDLTATAITNVVVELLHRPNILQEAIAAAQNNKDTELAGYIWEALRFRQPSPGVINTCVQDYTLGKGTPYAQTIPAGTQVMACSISAMHDPSVIDQPTEFIVGRPAHLAYTFFEAGLHTCHGKYFSQVQIPLAVQQILKLGTPSPIDPLPKLQGYPTQPFRIRVAS
ncbi:MAG TPA: cytochrome P450 [Stenomitos sp.]